jgi:DNA invertase Pin-like site-specific DNA recombinase
MVTRIDRLARSEQPIDTSTAAGKAFLDMLGVFAEFETNLRKERQLEGIAKAKAAGVYKGRKPTVDAERERHSSRGGLARRLSRGHLELGVRPSIGHSASRRARRDRGLIDTSR